MALVQQSTELVNNTGSGTGSVSFGSAIGSGNLVVLVCWNVDTQGRIFTSSGFGEDAYRATSSGGSVVILSKPNVTGSPTSFTVTYDGGSKFRVIGYEFDSVVTTSHVEASAANNGNTGGGDMYAAASGSIDTTQGGPILVAYICDRTPSSWTGPSGWTGSGTVCQASSNTLYQGFTNYKIATGASTDERGVVTPGGSGPNYDGVIVAYKAAAGGGSSIVPAISHSYRQRRAA